MIAMRALGDPDAFPESDMGVVKAARDLGITDLSDRAAAWRPWRSYATHYLWLKGTP
jgi:AraC family transcriptional regulator of adaptative response / DNA-3-methyladenine glycosylase II